MTVVCCRLFCTACKAVVTYSSDICSGICAEEATGVESSQPFQPSCQSCHHWMRVSPWVVAGAATFRPSQQKNAYTRPPPSFQRSRNKGATDRHRVRRVSTHLATSLEVFLLCQRLRAVFDKSCSEQRIPFFGRLAKRVEELENDRKKGRDSKATTGSSSENEEGSAKWKWNGENWWFRVDHRGPIKSRLRRKVYRAVKTTIDETKKWCCSN